jgi:amidase
VPTDPSPTTEELAYLTAGEAQERMQAGELTSERLVESLITRIGELDGPDTATALRAVIAVDPTAVEQARRSDEHRRRRGSPRALEGIPVLIKDNVEAAGLPSTAGSTSLLGRPPLHDAPLVARLREAGAVILGTTNLSQWANIRSPRSSGGWSAVGGLTGNPWALDRNAGGSSSGSGAAVAAGFAPLAIGTETDGSITCPSSLNGVSGIKPAVGAVPTGGVVPISHSQDSPGPMARSCADLMTMLAVLTGETPPASGPSPAPAASATSAAPDAPGGRPSTTGLAVGVARNWMTGHPATDALVDEALHRMRAAGVQIKDTQAAYSTNEVDDDEMTVLLCELKDDLDAYLPTRGPGGPQSLVEVIAHEDAHAEVEMPWFGHELFELAVSYGGCGTDRYREARRRNLEWALKTCLEPAMEGVDVLVAPTYAPAWKSDLVLGGHPAIGAPTTRAPSIAGWPIATVPMGLADGLPVGLALIGRPGSEYTLLALGAHTEAPARPAWRMPGRG